MINLLDDATNQPSKFITRNWVEINDESKRRYDNSNRFKTTTIRPSLCDYSDTYILVKGTIAVPNTAAANKNINKKQYKQKCNI